MEELAQLFGRPEVVALHRQAPEADAVEAHSNRGVGAWGEILGDTPSPPPCSNDSYTDPSSFTKRYDTLDEKVEAFHAELEDRVADLADDENWQAYLATMSQFHRYSAGGAMLLELRQCGSSSSTRGGR